MELRSIVQALILWRMIGVAAVVPVLMSQTMLSPIAQHLANTITALATTVITRIGVARQQRAAMPQWLTHSSNHVLSLLRQILMAEQTLLCQAAVQWVAMAVLAEVVSLAQGRAQTTALAAP
jgi:hypothetical protein